MKFLLIAQHFNKKTSTTFLKVDLTFSLNVSSSDFTIKNEFNYKFAIHRNDLFVTYYDQIFTKNIVVNELELFNLF